MTLTYLVSTHNEPQGPDLITFLHRHKAAGDDIVVLDDFSHDGFFNGIKHYPDLRIVQHKLVYSYAEHRNHALPHCRGDFIFVLDADEMPQRYLFDNLKNIITANPADIIWVPRLNQFAGATAQDAANYGWHLQDGLVNWNTGDYQCRLFRNHAGIKWHGNLHERLEGGPPTTHFKLKKDESFAIIHRKTIEQQRASNARYRKNYTAAENVGQH